MVSPRAKFIIITIDEVVFVVFAVIAVWYFLPDLLVWALLLAAIGTPLFVIAKYYIVYPTLQEGGSVIYDVVGSQGRVVRTVTPKSGKIRTRGEIWNARCLTGEIPEGSKVVVTSREGMTVIVEPVAMREGSQSGGPPAEETVD